MRAIEMLQSGEMAFTDLMPVWWIALQFGPLAEAAITLVLAFAIRAWVLRMDRNLAEIKGLLRGQDEKDR